MSKSILIIDDARTITDITSMIFEKEGFKVYRAYSGETGLEIAEKMKPDLILLDIMMPDLSGWDVLDALRNNEDTKDIRVVFFSAKTDEEENANNSDVDGFIKKPFVPDTIVKKVKEIIGDSET